MVNRLGFMSGFRVIAVGVRARRGLFCAFIC